MNICSQMCLLNRTVVKMHGASLAAVTVCEPDVHLAQVSSVMDAVRRLLTGQMSPF